MKLIDWYHVWFKDNSKKKPYWNKHRTAYLTLPEAIKRSNQIMNGKLFTEVRIVKETKTIIKEMK